MVRRADIAAAIEELSEAQKNAICGIFAWRTAQEAEAGDRALFAMGLLKYRGGLTEYGEAVRSALLEARER